MEMVTHLLQEMLAELWEIFPYFMAGVLLEAFIRTMKWHVKIRKTLTHYGFAAIAIATALGIISPLCACGILPLTISLILGGLPLAPAMSLLVASPLMSPAGYSLAVKNIGPQWANAEVLAAIFMGLFAGTIVHLLERRGFNARELFKRELPEGDFHDEEYPEEILRCACNDMFSKKVEKAGGSPISVYLAKVWEGGYKVGKYMVLGVFVSILVRYFIPDAWLDALLTSTNPLAVIGITLGAVPLHITQITATAFMFGLMDAGISPAAGMALLVGGPVTALPVMSVFLTLFRPKVFWLYIGLCVTGTLIVAYLFQTIAG